MFLLDHHLLNIIQVFEKDLETLYVEANIFSLVSHIFWALWGLIQVIFPLLWSLCFLNQMTSSTVDIGSNDK